MTSMGRPRSWRASSVSASMKSVMPLTRAWLMRLLTSQSRQARSLVLSAAAPPPLYLGARSMSRSVASGRRLRITSSTASRSSAGMSS